ncbi:MAG: Nif3-like dinuclear metal center hexameric protein [Bacteroidales bacterium]
MKALEIIKAIEDFAPGQLQESWDNSGLIVGDADKEVRAVLLALDCTPEIISEAIETGAGMIITHHPLIFKGIKRIGTNTVQERMITSLIKNDIVLYSMHTNIDKVPEGVSSLMAKKLGLKNLSFLLPDSGGENGLGLAGDLEKEMEFSELIDHLKRAFPVKTVRFSKPVTGGIKRVAVCGGSGGSIIREAVQSGASVYITGDISYHNFFCEDGFMIIDIGHFESEIDVLELLMSVILKKIPNFAVRIARNNNNPIYYQ